MAESAATWTPEAEAAMTGAGDTAVPDLNLDDLNRQIEEMRKQEAELEAQLAEGKVVQDEKGSEDGEANGDTASIYVGQVDYNATPEELHNHFQKCGTVKRVTILCDKWTQHPKGYAYLEFEDPEAVEAAVLLNDTLFCGRKLKVMPKRANLPGYQKGKGGKKGGKKGGYKGGKGWWDSYSTAGYHPYAAGGKGKGGKKAGFKGGYKGYKGAW